MLDSPRATGLVLLLLAIVAGARGGDISTDRRVVDTVHVGHAASEADHGYAAYDDSAGVAGGRTFRQARGWMRYALTTFDDTDVTIECTFIPDSVPRAYDVVVEDSVIATRMLAAEGSDTVVVNVAVPFALTKGRTNIAVLLRGRDGFTPALHRLRTVQDHHEIDHAAAPSVARSTPHAGASPSLPNLPGVAR